MLAYYELLPSVRHFPSRQEEEVYHPSRFAPEEITNRQHSRADSRFASSFPTVFNDKLTIIVRAEK